MRSRSFASVAVGLVLAAGVTSAADAQRGTSPAPSPTPVWRAELGAAVATPLVEDGNGVTVIQRPGAFAGVDVAKSVQRGVAVTLGVRATVAPLRAQSSGRSWRTGSSQQYDLTAALEITRFAVGAMAIGVMATRLRGPRDVLPFRTGSGVTAWGAEMALGRRVARTRPIEALIGARLMRLPSQQRENPALDAGWVGQLRAGFRHAL